MGENDGDSVTSSLESLDKGVDVRGGFVRRRSIVIYYLNELLIQMLVIHIHNLLLTRICILNMVVKRG